MTPAAASFFGSIQPDPHHSAVQLLAIQILDGGTTLVSLHINCGKAFALAREDVFDELDRTDRSVIGKESGNALFGGGTG